MSNFYKELPSEYSEDYVIDAKNKKTLLLFGVFSILLTFLSLSLFIPKFIKLLDGFSMENKLKLFIYYIVFIVGMILYIVLHELTHGMMYKIFTHEKLTYGFTLTVAYCGVPKLYVDKKTSLFSILAPFVLYTLIFLPITIITNDIYLYTTIALLFSIHFGGCIGDLYGTIILIFKYKGKSVLMNDTGPRQTFYIKK